MTDVVNRVKTIYTAETAQAAHAVRTLRGVERDEAKKVLDALNAHNAKLNDHISMIGKVTAAVGAVTVAYAGLRASVKAYLEDQRIGAAAAGADIDRLRRATAGLVEEDQLLIFAGKAMNGTWNLNQQQMERVLHGAMALRKTMGVELQPTIEKLTEAVAKGATKSLKEFGITAKGEEATLRQLDALWASIGGNAELVGDEFSRAEVGLTDAMDNLKGAMGELAVQSAPLLEIFTGLVGVATRLLGVINKIPQWLVPDGSNGGRLSKDQQLLNEAKEKRARAKYLRQNARKSSRTVALPSLPSGAGGLAGEGMSDWFSDEATVNYDGFERTAMLREAQGLENDADQAYAKVAARSARATLAAVTAGVNAALAVGKEGEKKEGRFELNFAEADGFSGYSTLSEKWAADVARARRLTVDDIRRGLGARVDPEEDALAAIESQFGKQRLAQDSALARARGAGDGQERDLAQILGTRDVYDHADSVKALASAFGVLQDASAAAYDELVKGSEASMAAFNKVIASGIAAMGKEMFVKGISESAWGIADLARGNLPGAATHATSAAKFFAGAAIAGVVANQLGYGSGGGAGRLSAGGGAARDLSSGARPSSSGDGEGRTTVIYVGAEVAGMSAIERADYILRAERIGRRGSNHIRRH